jgi:ribosomal protein S27AE
MPVKHSGICSKCGSGDLLFIPGGDGSLHHDNVIRVGLTIISTAEAYRYVCCDCGYSEEWVDLRDIPKLKKKYGGKLP